MNTWDSAAIRMIRLAALLAALLPLGAVVSASKAYAVCNGTWTGNAGDKKWETASNWSGNCVPNHDATIPDDSFVITISTPQSLTGAVSIGVGDHLTCAIGCTLTLSTVGSNISNQGSFSNFGTVNISTAAGGFFSNSGSTFENDGTFTITMGAASSGGFFNSGTVLNRGMLSVTAGASSSGGFFNDGPFSNFGTVSVGIGAPGSSGGFYNSDNFTNHGMVNILGPEFRFANSGTFIDACNGTVSEAPTSGNPVLEICRLAPALSPLHRSGAGFFAVLSGLLLLAGRRAIRRA
ncbi:MAG: hypothetical protein HY270_14020 [Deltaproteobacteria bacterium]|nr:hypothetical protein [Deltaproteobacteria bacterium]